MENEKTLISILVPCYNEEENVEPLSAAIIAEFEKSLPAYDYEILFIDNNSTDTTRPKLEALCAANPRIKAIFNIRNFGQFSSPYYGICQTSGACTIPLCADFQDPIEMIPKLVAKWEAGYKVVCAVKSSSKENKLMRFFRTCYYKLIRKTSSVEQIEHFTGFGLYDKSFVEVLRNLDDPTPFLRSVVSELSFKRCEVEYEQAERRAGKTHNNFATLYDAAMLSFTSYTKFPIRLFTFLGAFLGAVSGAGLVLSAVLSLLGLASNFWVLASLIGLFGSINTVFIGIVGEYVLNMKGKILRRPLVIEEKRINLPELEK